MTLTAPGLIAAVLNIEPPYWAAPLVFAVYAVLATVAVYAGLRFFRIRERRRKEARLAEEEMRRREAMDRMKLRFFTSVSDDLRTPLTLIITPLEKMLRSATDHRQAHTLSLMHRNAEKLMSFLGMVGMPVVREYVGLHDGTVEIVRDEKGSVFRVTMPIRHSDSADADGRNEVLSEEVEEASGCETSEKPVALIVDDSHDMLELVRDGLEDGWHGAMPAAEGKCPLFVDSGDNAYRQS